MRHNRSARSSRPGAARLGSVASCRIDSADKNSASFPGATIRPARAAKTAVGSWSAMPTWHSAPDRGHRVDQPLSGGLLGPEVAGRPANRQYQQSRPQHLGAGHQIVHRGRHVLEVAGIARRVGGDDVQLRASGLRFPTAQTPPHPRRAGRRRAGDDPVGQRDRHRGRRGQAGRGRRGHGGPVHAPDGQHPGNIGQGSSAYRTHGSEGPSPGPHGQPHPADPPTPGWGSAAVCRRPHRSRHSRRPWPPVARKPLASRRR